ncbi:hypothetical protein Xekj_04355 [Xenorhabdus sp. KJ12.1]|nr:hypothetical protein Xekj_04355 [Xenorhabdus sp. KJ12.1]
MLVKLKVIQTSRQVITEMQGVAIHTFADRTPGQAIPLTGNFPSVDAFANWQASDFVILIFDDSIGVSGFHQLIPFVVFISGGGFKF